MKLLVHYARIRLGVKISDISPKKGINLSENFIITHQKIGPIKEYINSKWEEIVK